MDKRRLKQRPKKSNKSSFWSGLALWGIIFVFLSIVLLYKKDENVKQISFSQFYSEISAGHIRSVIIADREVLGEFKLPVKIEGLNYVKFRTLMPYEDVGFVNTLIAQGIEVQAKPYVSIWSKVWPFLPFLLLIAFWFILLSRASGIPKQALSFGQSRAKRYLGGEKVTFNDAAGCDEAKAELKEIVEFLKSPAKYERLGAKIPKGVLLLGAPGTGKTLLARATAGEAGVPFFSMSGSDFVELFVGVGASRVRDLFEKGKKNKPCIIFIDELDAVGRHRGAGIGGGHDEREQTLNALLVEMDGFEANKGIIVMSATNRPDILDPALLRPGRFDRRIVVDRPDLRGREEIFKIHTRKVPLSNSVKFDVLARATPGFSGADIASTVNESALLAAKRGKNKVEMLDFEEARDKVLMGTERKSLLISESERRNTACHEAGHVLVSKFIPETDPIHKVTIIPRGMALGITQHLPIDERRNYSKEYCLAQIAVLCGGRAAEVIMLNTSTTGARNDIEETTILARKMVCSWGMSNVIGPMALGEKQEEIFLGREIAQHRDYSEEMARLIDKEITKIVRTAEERAKKIITEHRSDLEKIVNRLLEKEVLTGDEIDNILKPKVKPKKSKISK
ncbi:MAG: ATP-dependent metallopeptidase FtsH/Yme1/Tma family protein [Candidatus Stahlbacteria bacterium]|nr:ATP-dependent metallopeptidase FtsH/Yme1/Tma family protein [Candidatus Stahlbacteria bacterium]